MPRLTFRRAQTGPVTLGSCPGSLKPSRAGTQHPALLGGSRPFLNLPAMTLPASPGHQRLLPRHRGQTDVAPGPSLTEPVSGSWSRLEFAPPCQHLPTACATHPEITGLQRCPARTEPAVLAVSSWWWRSRPRAASRIRALAQRWALLNFCRPPPSAVPLIRWRSRRPKGRPVGL